MSHPNPSTALASVVVDELAAGGVGFVAISPGSRSGALAVAAARHPELVTRIVIDERSAAFHALGVSRATGGPAAVLATSGTAPANFFPAVVEADMSGVPLILLSADRPSELRGVGANQTIDQVELFGSKVRAYREIDAPGSGTDLNLAWRETISEVIRAANGPCPGPVHLNVAFREPTVPVTDDGRSRGEVYEFPTSRGHPLVPDEPPSVAPSVGLESRRGLVIAGDGDYDRSALLGAARDLGWPVVATALSGLRGEEVADAYHFTLAAGIPEDLRPESVVAVGAIGPDPVLEDLVAAAGARVRVDRWGRHIDPRRNATQIVAADPVELLAGITGSEDGNWRQSWLDADRTMRARVARDLAENASFPGLSGARVAALLNEVDRGAMVVASSLPIREVDAHLVTRGPVYANRGASGIDGFVSTALGVATSIPRTLAMCGDLSLLHDSNGFLHDGNVDLTMVVIDNHGGGLFDSLPQARHAPDFERLFVTPPDRDLARLASFHRIGADRVEKAEELIDAVEAGLGRAGVDLVLVPVDRGHDLVVRSRVYV